MPRRDGTGPLGYGPLTGRGLGLCRPRFLRRSRIYADAYNQERNYDERSRKEYLQEQLKYLENQIDIITKELGEL
ncbi:MAG: DUF5320 domain-containing protein [Bacilli bacterium]|nr:DUF5320 domain-containing protein [Bacilli bacterium]MDD4077479.1 DUF5320 domain-containing protein [Bacilli bacterium]MDD4388239.1 DUF5320 domain-containing protein [Bacilli bacterium]